MWWWWVRRDWDWLWSRGWGSRGMRRWWNEETSENSFSFSFTFSFWNFASPRVGAYCNTALRSECCLPIENFFDPHFRGATDAPSFKAIFSWHPQLAHPSLKKQTIVFPNLWEMPRGDRVTGYLRLKIGHVLFLWFGFQWMDIDYCAYLSLVSFVGLFFQCKWGNSRSLFFWIIAAK